MFAGTFAVVKVSSFPLDSHFIWWRFYPGSPEDPHQRSSTCSEFNSVKLNRYTFWLISLGMVPVGLKMSAALPLREVSVRQPSQQANLQNVLLQQTDFLCDSKSAVIKNTSTFISRQYPHTLCRAHLDDWKLSSGAKI